MLRYLVEWWERMVDFIDHEKDVVVPASLFSSHQCLIRELVKNPTAFMAQRVRVLGVLESFDVPNQVGVLKHGEAKILIRSIYRFSLSLFE